MRMILPLVDLAALAWFLLMWIGYDRFADYWSQVARQLAATRQ